MLKMSKKCDNSIESYSTTGDPKMFPTTAASLGNCIAAQGEYFDGDPTQ
jgi:hypothetical protein